MGHRAYTRWSRVLLTLCLGIVAHAHPLDSWVQRSPLPTSADIVGITWVNGQFLASAGTGGVLSSRDGVDWTGHLLASSNNAFYAATSIAWGGGTYVAAGYGGALLTSPDVIHWTPQWSGVAQGLLSVVYGKGRFVAVGGSSGRRAILTSADGTHWTVRRQSDEGALFQVIFAQDQFLAVGNFGTILSSFDGIEWRSSPAPRADRVNGIAYGNGRYVAVGEFGQALGSSNGLAWSTNGPALQSVFPTIAFGGDQFVIVDGDRVWTSTDGVEWTAHRASGLSNVAALAYGNGLFVAVGTHGYVATSADGLSWAAHQSGPDVLFHQVTAGNGLFLATGDGSREVGPNDYQLTNPLLKMSKDAGWIDAGTDQGYLPLGLSYAGGEFIIFARDNRNPAPVFVLNSPDGAHWTKTDLGSAEAPGRVIYANGQFVAVGGGIFNSPDGRHWTVLPTVTLNTLTGLAFGNGRFIAVGNQGEVFLSTTGTNWFARPTGTNWLTDVTFGNGQFVAVGNGSLATGNAVALVSRGQILTSPDGEHWSRQTTPFGPSAGIDLVSIASGAGWFVAVGEAGTILTSPDGVHWAAPPSGTSETLASVAYADGAFVAVGSRGITLVSRNILAPLLESPTAWSCGFSFTVGGLPGQVYHVQATTDLASPQWTEVGTVTNETGHVVFFDANPCAFSQRFYRAVNP
jgi:hypothetical protein